MLLRSLVDSLGNWLRLISICQQVILDKMIKLLARFRGRTGLMALWSTFRFPSADLRKRPMANRSLDALYATAVRAW